MQRTPQSRVPFRTELGAHESSCKASLHVQESPPIHRGVIQLNPHLHLRKPISPDNRQKAELPTALIPNHIALHEELQNLIHILSPVISSRIVLSQLNIVEGKSVL